MGVWEGCARAPRYGKSEGRRPSSLASPLETVCATLSSWSDHEFPPGVRRGCCDSAGAETATRRSCRHR
eukprot:14918955-Alexandrium_andersonii.AAC.1